MQVAPLVAPLLPIADADGSARTDVEPLSAFERKQFKRLPHKDESYRKFLGVPQLFGERGYSVIEQRSARPTLEINGLTSGYQGEGSKTIVPSHASCKITIRLVPDQKPQTILRKVKQHLKAICPPGVKMTFSGGHEGDPYIVAPDSHQVRAGLTALKAAFGAEPIVMREGGSISSRRSSAWSARLASLAETRWRRRASR